MNLLFGVETVIALHSPQMPGKVARREMLPANIAVPGDKGIIKTAVLYVGIFLTLKLLRMAFALFADTFQGLII